MTKATAQKLNAYLKTRNSFVLDLEATIENAILGDEELKTFEVSTPDLPGEIIDLVAKTHDIVMITFSTSTLAFKYGETIKERQRVRKDLDRLIQKQAELAIANGTNSFTIDCEKDAKDQPEVASYLRYLGFEITSYRKRFTVSF